MTPNELVDGIVDKNPVLRAAYQNGDILSAKTAGLQAAGESILAMDDYMNQFITTLVNRIAFTEARNRVYNNPLRIFKGDAIPYGNMVQELIANPAIGTAYDKTAMADVLSPASPDVKAMYYRQNRQDKYKVTVYDEGLRAAFASADAFNNFVSAILDSMTSGDNIDEYTVMRDMLGVAINAGTVNTHTVPPFNGTNEEALAKAIVRTARSLFMQFQFPSSDFNGYMAKAAQEGVSDASPLITWTDPNSVVIFIRADVAALISVDVLASAFNMSKADFMGRQVIVDKFGNDGVAADTYAIVADEAFIKARDTVYKMAAAPYNASTMSRTWFLHHWGVYHLSPIANAVAIVGETL